MSLSLPVDDINPYQAPKSRVGRGSGVLLPHHKAGRVIRLFGWLGAIAGVGVLIAILLPVLVAGTEVNVLWLALPISVILFFCIPPFVIGSAVMDHKPWGRIAGIIYGVLCLPGIPVGTIAGMYILWQLLGKWDDSIADSQ